MDRLLTCPVCHRSFQATRRHATCCGPKCRKQLSRSNGAGRRSRKAPAAVTLPGPPVTLPGPTPVLAPPPRGGWLPVVAQVPEPEPEKTAAVFLVPTRVDPMFGRLEDFVVCESPEAAAHWDERRWHR